MELHSSEIIVITVIIIIVIIILINLYNFASRIRIIEKRNKNKMKEKFIKQ